MDELNQVINKLPRGKCADSAGYIREIFICGGKNFRRSVLDMINKIKHSQAPQQYGIKCGLGQSRRKMIQSMI